MKFARLIIKLKREILMARIAWQILGGLFGLGFWFRSPGTTPFILIIGVGMAGGFLVGKWRASDIEAQIKFLESFK